MPAPFSVWQWLTIRAGVPVVTTTTQDAFVAQTVNWDVLSGIDFQKGCYTGQEIIARMQYLGRLKERLYAFHADADVAAGVRLYSATFGEQSCGTVVNAAPAPGGGCDVLAIVQIAAADSGDVRANAPDGPLLARLPLPYAVPAAQAPRGRISPAS
jgi:folate-binding protein YgfZ